MGLMEVVHYGDPILRKKCKPVTDFEKLPGLIEDMFDTMYEEEGIGLAANQIGVDLNVMVIDISHADENCPPSSFLNGQIIERSGSESMEEGCLSVPGVRVEVTRAEKVTFAYQDLEGNHHEAKFDGLMARVIQHEMDHINGLLIIDHASQLDKHRIRKQLKELAS